MSLTPVRQRQGRYGLRAHPRMLPTKDRKAPHRQTYEQPAKHDNSHPLPGVASTAHLQTHPLQRTTPKPTSGPSAIKRS